MFPYRISDVETNAFLRFQKRGAEDLDKLKITWVDVDDAACDDNGNGIVVFADFDNRYPKEVGSP